MSVRVRFAPSPTGPLHIGGVRTALYNYLFAKANGGKFLLRIEDPDQTRFVKGAEEYIVEALNWCGLTIDEGDRAGGEHGPYKQSLRFKLYSKAVDDLIASGNAYRAFDTPKELAIMRAEAESRKKVFQYDARTRGGCKNELSMSSAEVDELLANGVPHVVRFKTPEAPKDVVFNDEIRGKISVSSTVIDDKILMKMDGLPTYHLANVVDDHHMEISHVIRGEEWLPSAPLHILLYRAFKWNAPKFAHLPLILKPKGNGKLSKRDGDAGGFPVFPIEWKDPKTGSVTSGYREQGYDPQAFINMLLMLGWNPGGEKEKFTLEEAVDCFSLDRIVKSGARFSPDKAKWYNELYLREKPHSELVDELCSLAAAKGLGVSNDDGHKIVGMMLERVSFLKDIFEANWLFETPSKEDFNLKMVKNKWKDETSSYLEELSGVLEEINIFNAENIEAEFKGFLEAKELGFGQVLLPFRIALTGSGGGPSMFEFAEFLGKETTMARLQKGIDTIAEIKAELNN